MVPWLIKERDCGYFMWDIAMMAPWLVKGF